jgi:hypothetical protein
VSTKVFKRANAVMIPEPYVIRQSLPACRNIVDGAECRAPHPLNWSVWKQDFADPTQCPKCGGPASPAGERIMEKAAFGGFLGWIANGCFGIARKLAALARRISP